MNIQNILCRKFYSDYGSFYKRRKKEHDFYNHGDENNKLDNVNNEKIKKYNNKKL